MRPSISSRHHLLASLVLAMFAGLACAGMEASPARLEVRRDRTTPSGGNGVLLRGVGAGPFEPRYWQAGTLHWVADAQDPLLEPKPGKWRNIYAPSVVQTAEGWRLFYG